MADTLSPTGLDQLRAIAERHVASGHVPGLVALVASGGQAHVVAHGTLSIGGAPVARDSLFRIASMTKPVTGAATMALVEEGLVGLDEPVERLLPELADRRVLRDLAGPLDDTGAGAPGDHDARPAHVHVRLRLRAGDVHGGRRRSRSSSPRMRRGCQLSGRRTRRSSPIPIPGSPVLARCR